MPQGEIFFFIAVDPSLGSCSTNIQGWSRSVVSTHKGEKIFYNWVV
jgi:hypothetical protein